MSKLIVVDHNGNETLIKGVAGSTVMTLIRDSDIDGFPALCGGCCSCATCHVWVDPAFISRFPEPSSDENDMLDSSEHRKTNSRLSCQLTFADNLDGLRVTLTPED